MIDELATKVHPIFRELVAPPCVSGDTFKGCVYHEECRRRYTGDDALPPCPLHIANHVMPTFEPGASGDDVVAFARQERLPRVDEMAKRIPEYEKFWGRNVATGRRLPVLS